MLDLHIFLSWFWRGYCFSGKNNIMDRGSMFLLEALIWSQNVLMQLFTTQDINWWTGVMRITCGLLWCFYQVFGRSFWWHPFTAENPLVSKWCNATFLQICSDEICSEKNHLDLSWGWVNFKHFLICEQFVHFINHKMLMTKYSS